MSVRAKVDEHIAAFNAHDTARLLSGLAPDAVWTTGHDTIRGRDALADLFDDWLWSLDPRLEPVSTLIDGERAAVQLRESIADGDERREFHVALFVEFAAGLITRAKVYREGSAEV